MVEPALFALHFRAFCLPVTLILPFGSTDIAQVASPSVAPIESCTSALPMAHFSSFGLQQVFLLLAISTANAAVPPSASTRIGAPVSLRTQKALTG